MKHLCILIFLSVFSNLSFANNCNLKSRIFTDGKLVNFDNHIIKVDENLFIKKVSIKGTEVEINISKFGNDIKLNSSSLINIKTTKNQVRKFGDRAVESTIEGVVNSSLISYFNDSKIVSTLTCFLGIDNA